MADEMIIEVMTKAREAIQHAQEQADDTPRPINACPAHDSQFALTKALTGGVDTLLMAAQQYLRAGFSGIPSSLWDKAYLILLKPWPWVAIIALSFSPQIIPIIDKLSEVFKK